MSKPELSPQEWAEAWAILISIAQIIEESKEEIN